jgi:hypothetical protein
MKTEQLLPDRFRKTYHFPRYIGQSFLAFSTTLIITLSGCTSQPISTNHVGTEQQEANKDMIVDCLLPAQIRKLANNFVYLPPRRSIKTTISNCEKRSGEIVSYSNVHTAVSKKI